MSFCVPTRGDERPGCWRAVKHLVPLPLVCVSHPGTYRAARPRALNLHFFQMSGGAAHPEITTVSNH